METVGIRELKRNLSKYLRSVKDGEKVVVTETGKKRFLVSCLSERLKAR